jgi:hypothetical protein
MWRRNGISADSTKGRLLYIKRYFRWYLIIVGVEQIVDFPQESRCYERKVRECIKDVRYWISEDVVSDSAALASPPLPSDSKALRSESDIFATSARGSCGVDPGPVPLRIITLSASPMGDSLYGVRKRLVLSPSLMFSSVAMVHFTVSTIRGGGTDLALIRPRKGSPGVTGVFEGIAPSSA